MQPNNFFSLERVIDRQPLTVAPETALTEVISLMQEWANSCYLTEHNDSSDGESIARINNSCALVVRDARLQGIFTERDLVKLIATERDITTAVGKVMSSELITLTATGSEDVFTALNLLRQHGIRHLPVIDGSDRLLGLITEKSLRQNLQPINLMKWRRVEEIMNPRVIHALPSVSIRQAAQLMANHQVSYVAIVEQDKDRDGLLIPVGIITERDIVQFQTLNLDLAQPVKGVMSAPLFLVSPEESLWSVYQQMQQHRVRRLLVGGTGGELRGIITQTSLLQVLEPTKMYGVIEILQRQICQLEIERAEYLQNRTTELEQEVRERTTELTKANQQLQQEIAERQDALRDRQLAESKLRIQARQQGAIAELGQYALEEKNLVSLMERAVNLVASILEVEYCKVLELLPDGKNLLLKAGVGWYDELVGVATVKADTNSQAGYTLLSSEPVVVTDLVSETRFTGSNLLLDHQLVSGMSVIIQGRARPLGILGAHTMKQRIFSQDDINFLCAIANIIAQTMERQLTETSLRESRERYSLAVEGSHNGLWDWNILSNEVFYAPRWKEILGYTDAEIPNTFEAWESKLHPQDRERVLVALQNHLENRVPYDIEYRLQTKQGKYCWINGCGQAIWDENNRPTRMAGSISDISDRKRREEILKDIASGMSVEIGENFLPSLVEYLSKTLKVDYALVGELIQPETNRIKTLAVYGKGKTIDNFEYHLAGTPCQNVVGQQLCVYPSAIQQLFPDDLILQEMAAESYAGMPIFDAAGRGLGLIAIIDSKPFDDISLIEEVLKIFAVRFSSELERQQVELALRQSNRLLQAISWIQTQFLADAEPAILFDGMLDRLLALTESEYGFIGEILFAADGSPMMEESYMKMRGRPYLKTHAITNIAWNEETRAFYAENAPKGMEFHNLQTLFGAVIVTGKPVIANSPSTDPRRGGIPDGHPPLNAFLGVPFYKNDTMTGMVGIANREGGYDRAIVDYLQPFLATCSRIIEAYRSELEKQQAETTIREQAALLDVSTDAIIVRGLDNQILFWNRGAEKLYGWTKEEVLHRDANELLDRESFIEFSDIQHTVKEQGEWQGELNQITKAGKNIVVQSRWTLVKDEGENPQSYLVVNTDITEQKQLETQFLRTQRLESLGTLAGGIAHDLNNILAPILGFSRLLPLKLPDLDEQTQGFFKIMETNAQRGSALVKQILTFARGLEGDRGIVQIRHLIAEIGQIIGETFPKAIEFEISTPKNLWTVNGDANQLHQVLMNLAVNGRDAMPDGGKLTIKAENFTVDAEYARLHLDAKVGSYVLITVADTGVGIPPEIVDRIFEPFFTTKEIGRGTGLGLSTVLGIVKSHGGFVDLASDTKGGSRGTAVKVFLAASETAATETEATEAIAPGNGELILVVDDETSILEVTKATLETYNYRVLTANDGINAIAVYAQNLKAIDIVIMDIMMPSMDGKTAIRTLTQINPEVNIIAVSGLISSREIIAEIDDKITAYLAKPYTNDDLLKIINEVIHS